MVLFDITSNFLIINLLISPLKIKNIRKIPSPIKISKISIPKIPLSQTDKNNSLKFLNSSIIKFYIINTPLQLD